MRRSIVIPIMLFLFTVMATPAMAAEDGGSTLHYFGAAIGLGLVVCGAGYGISRLGVAAAESIARQPEAVAQITAAVNLPLFLLEPTQIMRSV